MQKYRLMFVPLCLGLMLIFYSWFLSYPLSIDTVYDFVFNHISILYWVGLPLTLTSLYIIASKTKSKSLKLIMCFGIVISMYSLNYFYYSLPGSDVQEVRGLTDYAIKANGLNPSNPHQFYFQWPLFFILNKMAYFITGLGTVNIEFLLFTILGFLYVASFYTYASRFVRDGSEIALLGYFIPMYAFLNYQFVPFSFALGFIFLLFMLETHTSERRGLTLATMVLSASITLMHPFAAVFFVIYELVMCFAGRDKNQHLRLFLFTLLFYLLVSTFYATNFLPSLPVQFAHVFGGSYTDIVLVSFSSTMATPPSFDAVAQVFSRTSIILTAAISGVGFLFLLLRRKLRNVDKSIFLSATLYVVAGAFSTALFGIRAVYLVFIPISLGATYFLGSRFAKYYKSLFLLLLILFVSIPLHRSFVDQETQFQTKEALQCANFMVDHYAWSKPGSLFSDFRFQTYLVTRTASNAVFGHYQDGADLEHIIDYDCIIYTVGLGKSFLSINYSEKETFDRYKYDVIFNSELSYIEMKGNSSYNKGD